MASVSQSARKFLVLALVVVLAQAMLAACGGSGDKRSVKAFCDTFKKQAIALHDKYENADKAIQTGTGAGTLTRLLTLIQSGGDMVVLFDALDKVAPDDIEPSVANVLDAMKQEEENNKDAFKDPLGAMGSGLILALESGGSYTNVDQYISQHCDLSFEK